MRQPFHLSFSQVLFLCFLCGAAAGTIGANMLGPEILRTLESGGETVFVLSASALDWGQRKQLWQYVFRQRATEFALAVLVGMTPFSSLGFAAGSFAAGMGEGFLLAMATLQYGIRGIFVFLLTLLPQWLFYLPVWIFLALKAEDGLEQVRLLRWPFLAAAAAAGIFLEAYVNPWFWNF